MYNAFDANPLRFILVVLIAQKALPLKVAITRYPRILGEQH